MICANSPQAKGRVERSFKTHQDRLVKENKLLGITTIKEGNVHLKQYIGKMDCMVRLIMILFIINIT